MISTRNLTLLPKIERLRASMQSMAMLDALLCPEWDSRYYSFNSKWSADEQMGSMRNGCGDYVFALFNAAGCFIKGYAHESAMVPIDKMGRNLPVWSGVLDSVPIDFEPCLTEPAFDMENSTFCVWRRYSDITWQRGKIEFPDAGDPDGSEALLTPFDGLAATYHVWAQDYYERDIDRTTVEKIFLHTPLGDQLVQELNDEITAIDVQEDAAEIDYPTQF